MMTTLVFPHGRGRDGTLMWALRSIAAHYDPATLDIVVAGYLPDWLDTNRATGLNVPQRQNRSMLNVWNALCAAAEFIGEGPFVLMNDDFFATAPADLAALTNRGPAADHIEAMRADPARSAYRSRLRRSVYLLAAAGNTAPASWETHTPLPTSGAAVRAAGAAMRAHNLVPGVVAQRTLMAELAGAKGHQVADPKVYTNAEVPIPGPWVSTSPVSWHGATGDAIRGTYVTPSPWELADGRDGAARRVPLPQPSEPTVPVRSAA
jgi:hypothetical protein